MTNANPLTKSRVADFLNKVLKLETRKIALFAIKVGFLKMMSFSKNSSESKLQQNL